MKNKNKNKAARPQDGQCDRTVIGGEINRHMLRNI